MGNPASERLTWRNKWLPATYGRLVNVEDYHRKLMEDDQDGCGLLAVTALLGAEHVPYDKRGDLETAAAVIGLIGDWAERNNYKKIPIPETDSELLDLMAERYCRGVLMLLELDRGRGGHVVAITPVWDIPQGRRKWRLYYWLTDTADGLQPLKRVGMGTLIRTFHLAQESKGLFGNEPAAMVLIDRKWIDPRPS